MPVKIFRVECLNCGYGPYTCVCDTEFHQYIQAYSSTDAYLKEHPGMYTEVPNPMRVGSYWGLFSQLYSGFLFEKTLIYWFSDIMSDLRQQEFAKVTYTVPKVLHTRSGKQIFFLKGIRKPQLQEKL